MERGRWMELHREAEPTDADATIVGIPYDGSALHDPGGAYAPAVLRKLVRHTAADENRPLACRLASRVRRSLPARQDNRQAGRQRAVAYRREASLIASWESVRASIARMPRREHVTTRGTRG